MDLFSIQFLLLLAVFSLILALLFVSCKPQFLQLVRFLKNRHRFLDWLTRILARYPTHTATYHLPGGNHGVVTASPANLEHMLKTNFTNYPKGDAFITVLEDFLGRGIFNSDGDLWKVQRKTASFEFSTKSLRHFVLQTVHREMQERLLPLLRNACKNEETIDLQGVFERFAFDNVCTVAFNEDPMCLLQPESKEVEPDMWEGRKNPNRNLSPDFARAFDVAASISADRFKCATPWLWKLKRLLNVGSERELKKAISTVHSFAMEIVRNRKRESSFSSPSSPPSPSSPHSPSSPTSPSSPSSKDRDLLSRFISASDSSDEFLRDVVISFILAGRDTTSSTLAWFFWLLSSKPQIERKILEEIASVRSKKSAQCFSFEELQEMHYLHASISEALRLYPPVAYDTKTSMREDVLPDGTFVGKGWIVSYSSYAMGRMKSIWGDDCLEFRPERWLEKDSGVFRPESSFKFPAFHGGPRLCLGKEMAYVQMKMIVACVLERFKIEVLNKEQRPQQLVSLTLRIIGGLPVRVKDRARKTTL